MAMEGMEGQGEAGFDFKLGDVPDQFLIPAGAIVEAEIRSPKIVWSKGEGTNKDGSPKKAIIGVNFAFGIVRPSVYVGTSIFDKVWLGTQTDPPAKDPVTRKSHNFITLGSYLKNAGVDTGLGMKEALMAANKQRLLLQIGQKDESFGGRTSRVNTILASFKLGAREVTEPTSGAQVSNGLDKDAVAAQLKALEGGA